MGGFMNGLGKLNINTEAERWDPLNGQHIGLKPPGAMRDQIQIGADFDASLDEFSVGEIRSAMFSQP